MNNDAQSPAIHSRYFNMDLARAVAIAMVTGFHLWRFFDRPQLLVADVDLFRLIATGAYGVDVFFVVSGFAMILTWERSRGQFTDRIRQFWLARLSRIYPAYLIAIVFWCVMLAFQEKPDRSSGPVDIVTHVLMIHTLYTPTFYSISGVFWTLAVEAHFYLLFPFLVIAPRWVRLMTAGMSLAYIYTIAVLTGGKPTPPLAFNAVVFLPLFVLGMEIAKLKATSFTRALAILGGGLAVYLALRVAPIFVGIPAIASGTFERLIIGGGTAAACLILVPQEIPRDLFTRAITTIGVASYSIYLYNYIFYFWPEALSPARTGVVAAVLWTAIVFCFGIAMWWLIERPFEKIRKSRKNKLHPLPAAMPVETR